MVQYILSSGHVVVGLLILALLAVACPCEADEVPAFFLKIAKNIPRVGRSNRIEDYFLKSAKNIPRIGRRDSHVSPSETMSAEDNEETFNGSTKRMINMPLPGGESRNWSNFPLAIEGPRELWRTLAAYTNEQSGFGPDAIDNEIWQRDKRTGEGAAMP